MPTKRAGDALPSSMNPTSVIAVSDEVHRALKAGAPIVALETAVITSGLPRTLSHAALNEIPTGWRADEPLNLEVGRAMERCVRDNGAIPATIGILDGVIHIGLSDDQLAMLARDEHAGKASISNLGACVQSRVTAGTTVSATLHTCKLVPQGGIRFLATGGIGGVHRNWADHPDISVDLQALSSTPVCVVCAGAKSILDIRATLEALETLAVPIVGYRTNIFPQFYSRGRSDMATHHRVDSPAQAAAFCSTHWEALRLTSSVLLVNPLAAEHAIDQSVLERAITLAEAKANDRGIGGPDRTPFLLAELARLTDGKTLHANVALLLANAALAASVAAC